MVQKVFITAARRTPMGAFRKSLSHYGAPELGSHAIKACLETSPLSPKDIDECIMGEVLTTGVGQAPARQAALGAGLLTSTPCTTVNKVCGSGLYSVMVGADNIRLKRSKHVMCGGQESMSQAPWFISKKAVPKDKEQPVPREQLKDSMIHDGLWDPYKNFHMGHAGELCASTYKVSREEQDRFAIGSYKKALEAAAKGHFKNEISPLPELAQDESPLAVSAESVPTFKPAFDKEGSITAANASSLNDGAAALILSSQAYPETLAEVVDYCAFAQEPEWFTTAPVGAIKKLLQQTGLALEDIDFFEINEAFSVVTQVAINELKIPPEKVNPHGGAVSLGHPIGASGARILVTLVHALKTHGKSYGVATLCLGGGEALALLVKNYEH